MRSSVARLALLAGLTALVVSACGDGAEDGSEPSIIFGTGEIPETIPDDFPIPSGAVIGSTLVDEINTRTEFEMRVSREQADLAQFFTVNLVNSGYVVDDSRLGDARWSIDFRRNALRGTIDITVPGPGIAQIVVEMNTA